MSTDAPATTAEVALQELGAARRLRDLRDAKRKLKKQFGDLQEQLEPVDKLLREFGSSPLARQHADSLQETHTSVLISFTLMLNYMNRITQSVKQPDILCLLTTFRDMALRYYTQFERTLLEALAKQDLLMQDADQIIQQIETMMVGEADHPAALRTGKDLLTESRAAAEKELKALLEKFPTLLQSALNKLKEEWQRLNAIAVADKEIKKNEKLIPTLDLVVEAARFSVGIDVSRIAVVPGDAFALQFYAYLRNFAILTVPIHSVQAPWEWSIFWHELAGEKVRRLEKNTAFEIESIRNNLRLIKDKWNKGDDNYRKTLLDFITRNNQYNEAGYEDTVGMWRNHFSRSVLDDFFSSPRLNWRDLGGFEHQFEQMLENLLSKEKFNQYEQIKADGWCVNWFKELFEDAWSVLAIRDPFINFLKDVLQRHVVEDGRHPPVRIRVQVADKILELMKSDAGLQPPQDIVEAAAQQILRFISLLMAPPMERVFEMTQTIKDPNYWPALRPQLSDFVGSIIGKYIDKWSKVLSGTITLTDTINETSKNSEDFNNELAEAVDFKKSVATSSQQPLDEIQPNLDRLLLDENDKDHAPKDYKKLLDLSFYDLDFLVGENKTFEFTYKVDNKPGKYKITSQGLRDALDAANRFMEGPLSTSGDVIIGKDKYLLTSANLTTLVGKGWVTKIT